MKNIVFILASSHTGSTMLDMMLSMAPNTASLNHFFLVNKENVTTHKAKVLANKGYCSFCGKDCKYLSQIISAKGSFHDKAFDVFGVTRLVDSSKKIGWIEACESNAKKHIIHLVRNGLDRLWSIKKANGVITGKAVRNWCKHEKRLLRYCEGKSVLRVKYEDVCDGDGLQACSDHIGVDYKEQMKRFWEKKHHSVRGNDHTISLMHRYHKMDLSQQGHKFTASTGYTVKAIHHDYDERDMQIFKDNGGEAMNRHLGY